MRDDFRALFVNGTPLLDVRAPVEFAKGAFPTSVNIPLMSNEQRHQVGVRYKQAGQQSAIALGAELVTPQSRADKVAAWSQFIEQHSDSALYCFRGGLRSRITQHWLQQSGVDIPLIVGGYKALRSFLIDTLDSLCQSLSLVIIGGRTGNGKTLLLRQLGSTVDLEALANHRGSSFGGTASEQPSNVDFENAVTIALLRLSDAGNTTIFLEDEARLIGRVCLPVALRSAMLKAPILILECDMQQRIVNCFDDYVPDLLHRYITIYGSEAGFDAYANHHRSSLARIRKRFGDLNYQQALELLDIALSKHGSHNDTSAYADFIELLLRGYYDPMYDYQLSQKQQRVRYKGTADELVAYVKTL